MKYLLLDRGVIFPKGTRGVAPFINPIHKDTARNPLFCEDYFACPPRKWEVRYDNAYPNVIFDPKYNLFRCYYTFFSVDPDSAGADRRERATRAYRPSDARVASLGYAQSADGVHWEKPALGLISFENDANNNILYQYAHGTGVFLDAGETDPEKRYKLVTKVDVPGGAGYMAVSFSEDGVHWGKMIPWPEHNPPADCHNNAFRDARDGKFKLITRLWRNGVRVAAQCESEDFIHWSAPCEILRGDGFASQVYSMPVFPYAGIVLGLASVYHEDTGRKDFDMVDVTLTYSSDGAHFDWVAPGCSLIPRGLGAYPSGEFDCGCVYAARPVDLGDGKLWIYYMGGNGPHTGFRETSFARGWIEKDKFAGYAPVGGGEAVLASSGMKRTGSSLFALAERDPGGTFSAALCEMDTLTPYNGFGWESFLPEPCDNGYTVLKWKNKDISSLGDRAFRIVFRLIKTRLYALCGDIACVSGRY